MKTSSAAAVPRSVRRDMEERETDDLRSWIENVGIQDMQFAVRRTAPTIYKDVQVAGALDTYNEPIDEAFIREQHGGGNFQVIVRRRNQEGKFVYFTTRTIKIAGPPKLEGLLPIEDREKLNGGGNGSNGNGHSQPQEPQGLAARAMESMERQLKQSREDASSRRDGFDPSIIATMQAPLMAQLQDLQRQMATKDNQILQLLTQKPEVPANGTFQDRILANMLENESSRIENLRAQHESEMRQLKEGFKQDLTFVRESAKEELRVREKQHERELDAIKDAQKVSGSALDQAAAMRIDGLKSEISRLERELGAAKIEIAELRAKKDKTLTEQAEEIVKVQDAFKALGVGGSKDEDDDADKPWYERMAGRVLENPEAIGQMLGGVRGAIAPPTASAAPQLPPPGQPFQTPDGKVFVMRPDGKAQRINPAARKKAAEAAAAVIAAKAGPRPPEAGEVAMAITFMESAISNGTAPEIFAQGARAAIPADVLAHVEKVGIDEFLTSANLEPTSALRSQIGRNWIRTVARILLEGA